MAQQDHENENPTKRLPRLLVMGPPSVFHRYKKQFSEKFEILRPWESPIPLEDFLAGEAADVQAMLCSGISMTAASAPVLRLLPSLKLIVSCSAGMNHIDLPECRRRGIAVTTAAVTFSVDVADAAVGLLIDVLRKISAANRFVKAGIWPSTGEYPLGSKLGGKRVGIVGLGSIGLEVAKRLEAFGCIISYNSTKPKSSVPYPFYSDICKLAADSDILVICCALTDQTRHMINKEVLSALGKKGVIVNVARGAIIDEKELVKCLLKGEIAGAGLDVFEKEPNVPKELLELENVVLSPHVAVFTDESFRGVFELVCGNLDAFFSNRPLISPVSFE